jgi:hypothetical protein
MSCKIKKHNKNNVNESNYVNNINEKADFQFK